ncbi:dual specificity protein phosphatase [Achlya hypogyna]|uniref:Dual specificity protein phosphatase n=1 Tax=Achlya hypogyna TaxID=1202772 RepID=A0A1V9ZGA0_ACHHY|nr:dual specificity protein phosphatase [Achlya hypogyna]
MAGRRPSHVSASFKSDLFTVRESFEKTPKHILVEVKNKRTRAASKSVDALGAEVDEMAIVQAAEKRILKRRPEETPMKKAIRWLGAKFGVPPPHKDMTLLTEYLALGSDDTAANYVELYDAGITHVCNVAAQCDRHFMGKFIYLHVKIKDNPELDIRLHFDAVFNFINRARDLHGRVFLHCVAGISRSVTFVVAYLLKHTKMNLSQAYAMVKMRRPLMCPNEGFRYQLALYEIDLYGTSSVMNSSEKDWDFYLWNLYQQQTRE